SEEEYSFLNEGKLSITSNNSNPEPIAPFTADFTSFPKELNYFKFFGPAENQAYWYFLGLIKRNCGSCWAFAAAGVVEGVYSWKTGHRKGVSLAKQELVDCAHEKYGYAGCDGCNGCRGDEALEYIRQNGIALTESYPYYAELGTKCLRSSVKRFIRPGAFEVCQLPADSNAEK
ncbi:PREDICTED: cathepsin L1-like, partial [Rhagoletis zephyria]|uniref:cathepsin L1-like n=1 Tax=Rhagoletis zephyria TaxID=28612 RepID=UPI00081174AF